VKVDLVSKKVYVVLMLALVLGAWLRIWGMDYGLPHPLTRPDEERIVGRAQTIFATGDWHPGSFFYPSLPFYLSTFALYIYYGLGKLAGSYDRPFDLLFEIAVTRPGLHYWICRWVSVLAGVATIAVTYALGRVASGSRLVGIGAAILLSVCHLHVRDSHFATVDIVMTFFVTLSLVFAVRAVEARGPSSYVLAGLAAGLATSCKYNAAIVFVPIVAAALVASRDTISGAKHVGIAALTASLAFAATSPYVLLRYQGFLASMQSLRSFLYGSSDAEMALFGHLRTTLPSGLGWPVFALAMVGALYATWRHRPRDIVLLSFFLSFGILISGVRLTFPRYVLPLIPLLVVWASQSLSVLKIPKLAWAVALLLSALPSLWSSIQFDRLASRRDTRLLASDWVDDHVPPQSLVLVCSGYGAPALNEDRRRPPAFRVLEIDCHTRTSLEERGAAYLVTDEHDQLSGFSRVHPKLSTWLVAHATKVASFDPYDPDSTTKPVFYGSDAFYLPFSGFGAVTRGGPRMTIWKLGADAS
jgi:4-amino-4-deoxy-L-arabinose transferase-like glycosyltransferase